MCVLGNCQIDFPAKIVDELSKLGYEQKQSLLEKEKSSGKDIFRQQILLDNASLDLGMAEIDLLDGNELQTRQKIEKVSISLENI